MPNTDAIELSATMIVIVKNLNVNTKTQIVNYMYYMHFSAIITNINNTFR